MKPIKIPFWMASGHLKKYADFLLGWFDLVSIWLKFSLTFNDIETVDINIVDLYAWQRDVDRVHSEPEWLYRKRVKFAYHNAKDAGSLAGFKRIWQRMELGELEIYERLAGRDWDVIELEVGGQTLADHSELLRILIEKYGLACRRYEWTSKYVANVKIRVQTFGNTEQCVTAILSNDRYEWLKDYKTEINMRVQTFENSEHNTIAKLEI